jgi:predicted ATP-dependent endonuclease of OLD family
MVCTHSPAFITGEGFENVRMVRFNPSTKQSRCKQLTFDTVADRIGTAKGEKPTKPAGMAAKLNQALQPALNELFFTKNLVLVEGLEDAAYVTSWMVLTDRWLEFRQKGLHIVPVNGKSYLAQPLVVAEGLGIPVFTVFDGDTDDAGHQVDHERDNQFLLKLLGGDAANSLPKDTIWDARYVIWPDNIGEVIKREIPADKLTAYENQANAMYGNAGGLHKNSLQIAAKLQLALEDGIRPASLEKLCEAVLASAQA